MVKMSAIPTAARTAADVIDNRRFTRESLWGDDERPSEGVVDDAVATGLHDLVRAAHEPGRRVEAEAGPPLVSVDRHRTVDDSDVCRSSGDVAVVDTQPIRDLTRNAPALRGLVVLPNGGLLRVRLRVPGHHEVDNDAG